jgi:hypothetical protein
MSLTKPNIIAAIIAVAVLTLGYLYAGYEDQAYLARQLAVKLSSDRLKSLTETIEATSRRTGRTFRETADAFACTVNTGEIDMTEQACQESLAQLLQKKADEERAQRNHK